MIITTHLSQTQRDVLANTLHIQLRDLEQQKNQRHGTDEASKPSEDDHEVAAALSDIDQLESDALTRALIRVHGTNFGLCVDCNQAIPFERLKIEPQTLRCLACQTLHEEHVSD